MTGPEEDDDCEDQPPHVVITLETAPDGCTSYASVHVGGGLTKVGAIGLLRQATKHLSQELAEQN